MLERIVPVVLAYNEAPNLDRTLAALTWARRVIVLDSESTDDTPRIAGRFSNVEFRQHRYVNHADKSNHALDLLGRDVPWVLFMDADYLVTDALREELARLEPAEHTSGYWIRFRYCIGGKPLRGSLYPPRLCLFRPERGRFEQHGHTQLLRLDGPTDTLAAPMLHDDRKPDAEFAVRQARYASLEADYLWSLPWRALGWRKRLRRLIVIAPWAAPVYVLFVKGLVLDGRAGLRYAWERAQAEWLIACALGRRMFQPHRKSGA